MSPQSISRSLVILALIVSRTSALGEELQPIGDALMVIPAEGGKPRQLIALRGVHCGAPRWSPDGEWIAFSTWPITDQLHADLKECDVYAVRASSGEAKLLGEGMLPAWSPDGAMLAWNTAESDKFTFGIVQVADFDSEAGTVRGVEPVHKGSMVTWVDEHSLYLAHTKRLFDLATGREVLNMRPPMYQLEHVGFARSNRRVAYASWVSDHRLQIVDLHDSPTFYIASRAAQQTTHSVDWSRDEAMLAASWRPSEDGVYQVVTLTPYGNDEPRIVEGQDRSRWSIDPSWSPDGSAIVYRSVNMSLGPYVLGDPEDGLTR